MMQLTMHRFATPDGDGHWFYVECENYDHELSDEIVAWCADRFGEQPETRAHYGGSRWVGSGSFWFRDEIDAIEFKMRWC